MKSLHIAAAQIHSGGPVEETLQRVERQVAAASVVGAQVILFAEVALHGFDYDLTPEMVESLAESVTSPNCSRIVETAKKYNIAILIGFFERDGDQFFNSQLVARPDGSRTVEHKHNITAIEQKAGLSRGQRERTVFEFNGIKTAIIICGDNGIEGLHEMLKEQGVEYRFCPTGGGGKMEDMLHEADILTLEGRKKYEENRPKVFKTQAILSAKECRCTGFTSANALGPVGKQTCHQGHCMIVDNNSVMRAQIPGTIIFEHQQDQMIHAVLNF